MPRQPKRNLLYLNSMSWEMMLDQGRMWEVINRDLGGYCGRCCSVFFGSEKNRRIEIEPGKNICYCIRNSPQNIKIPLLRYLYRVFFLITLSLRLRDICRKNKIDAIVSQSNALRELELASLFVSKIQGILILGYIGRNFPALKSSFNFSERIIHLMEICILRFSDKVILRPGSENLFSKYYGIDPSKIITIPHTTRFHEFTGTLKVPDEFREWISGSMVILYYGRLEEDKLVEDIIRAFRLVKNHLNNVNLLLIGSGKGKNGLELIVNELGLDGSVRIEPSMSQQKLTALSMNTDVHVHPTGGKGLLESAVMGKPVITYDSKTYDYGLINHMKTGLKANFRNYESMAYCIIKYLENADLRKKHGETLKKKAIAESDLTEVQKKFSSAIEKAIIDK